MRQARPSGQLVVGRPLAEAVEGRAGEELRPAHRLAEVVDRHALPLADSVHVRIGRNHVPDALLAELLALLVVLGARLREHRRGWGERHLLVPPVRGVRRGASATVRNSTRARHSRTIDDPQELSPSESYGSWMVNAGGAGRRGARAGPPGGRLAVTGRRWRGLRSESTGSAASRRGHARREPPLAGSSRCR